MSNKNEGTNYPFDDTEKFDNDNNCEFIFITDSIEKKQIARQSIISKKTALPTNKECKKKSGRVYMSFLYEDIMNYENYKVLPKEMKRTALIIYLNKHKVIGLAQAWDKTLPAIYSAQARLDIKKNENEEYISEKKTVSLTEFTKFILPSSTRNVDFHQKNIMVQQPESEINNEVTESVLNPVENTVPTIVEPEPTISPVIPGTDIEQDYILQIILPSKQIAGDNIANYLTNLTSMFDENNKIQIYMSINKISVSNFTFEIKIDDTFNVKTFETEFMEMIQSVPKNATYRLVVNAKEIESNKINSDKINSDKMMATRDIPVTTPIPNLQTKIS